MEDDRLLRERCQSLSETNLVRGLTLERADNSAAFVDEALRELERRATTLDACIDRVELRAGPRSGQTSINSALALVNDEVPRRAVASFTHSLGETLVLQRIGPVEPLLRLLQQILDLHRVGHQSAPLNGEIDAAAVAVEEANSQVALQLPHPSTHRRLRHVEGSGCRGKATGARHG